MTDLRPQSVDDVQACVRAHRPAHEAPLRPVAGRTKSALSAADAASTPLDLGALTGVLDYQPQESTFTARAATPLVDIEAAIAAHGQYLPFDPPFGPRGATLGGTVATAVSGPARYRYGGVRDFLLGVRFVDGEGRLVRGGGRVVKNAAGFYLHHLLLGSLGRLGAIVEITCKVFPAPPARATLEAEWPAFAPLVDVLARLRRTPFEIESIEIVPPGRLLVRLGGVRIALAERLTKLAAFLREGGAAVRQLEAAEDAAVWQDARELTWAPVAPGEATLVRIATTPGGLLRLEPALARVDAARRYGAGGEVAWVRWTRPLSELDALLQTLRLAGLPILGAPAADPYLGVGPDHAFLTRVRHTLDPRGVFAGVTSDPLDAPLASSVEKGRG